LIKLKYDRIIIGAGIYGLYGAIQSCKKGYKVLVLERDQSALERGSYINQARLHNGYHYPRSYATASKSSKYFERFYEDFKECINDGFEKIYAVAKNYSWASGDQFQTFSENLKVKCQEIDKHKYFKEHDIDKSFITTEYSFDASLIKQKLIKILDNMDCEIIYGANISKISKINQSYLISLEDGKEFDTNFILNSTYASINQIHELLGFEMMDIKYELCEVILCEVSDNLKNVGITVMDGPFFSIMPFGKTGYHSLTTVSNTPHLTSYNRLPSFPCQELNTNCSPKQLDNCNNCQFKPNTAFIEMNQVAKKFLNSDIEIKYVKSLFTIKPIMNASEVDDSRPTIIRKFSENPYFYTVFSGKLNTLYDLDNIL
jgi:hypothetical protein